MLVLQLPVHLGHDLVSLVMYRDWHDKEKINGSLLYQFIGAYFCFVFGGTTVADFWLGGAVILPVSISRIIARNITILYCSRR
jgi:hypothetical protein